MSLVRLDTQSYSLCQLSLFTPTTIQYHNFSPLLFLFIIYLLLLKLLAAQTQYDSIVYGSAIRLPRSSGERCAEDVMGWTELTKDKMHNTTIR